MPLNISTSEFVAVLGFLRLHHHIRAHPFPLGSVDTGPHGPHQGAEGLAFGTHQQETRGWEERVMGYPSSPLPANSTLPLKALAPLELPSQLEPSFRVLVAAPLLDPQV